ncbi:MAG TPA: SRPBCC family protein [Solirubrobacterales bacterium]|nr:SRPBCC family protein [Solirubrobacterales bacterium]
MASWKQQALIEAPVAEVWGILSDPARGPDWDEDLMAVTGAPTKIEKGSTFDLTARGPLGLKATTTFRVEQLEDMHELKVKCQHSGFYAHWMLTPAQSGTFTEVELGIEPLAAPSIGGRAAAALHTKSYLRREVDKLLDGLRRAVSRERTTAS